jgi:hypothetical protein
MDTTYIQGSRLKPHESSSYSKSTISKSDPIDLKRIFQLLYCSPANSQLRVPIRASIFLSFATTSSKKISLMRLLSSSSSSYWWLVLFFVSIIIETGKRKSPGRPGQICFSKNGYFNHGMGGLYAGRKAYYFVYPGSSRVVHWFDGPQFLVVIFGWFPPGPTPME